MPKILISYQFIEKPYDIGTHTILSIENGFIISRKNETSNIFENCTNNYLIFSIVLIKLLKIWEGKIIKLIRFNKDLRFN